MPTNLVHKCPHCQSDLTYVCGNKFICDGRYHHEINYTDSYMHRYRVVPGKGIREKIPRLTRCLKCRAALNTTLNDWDGQTAFIHCNECGTDHQWKDREWQRI